jgi:agmatinase
MSAIGLLEKPITRDLSGCDVVALGVPFDLATTGRPGARFGPLGIRQASWHMSWEKFHWPWRFVLEDRLRLIDYGDIEFDTGDADQMVKVLQTHVREILAADKTLLTLGGDHFISLPLLREHAAKHGPLSLIHFDAHADTESIKGAVNHGSMFRQAHHEGLIDPARSVQVGIRTEYEVDYDGGGYPFVVLDATWVANRPAAETAAEIQRVVGEASAYLSFDIDCLDPAFAPGTGTPVPGGLSVGLALEILRGLVGCHLVGMDIVEVAPAYDHAEITSLAASAIALELLHVLAADPADLEAALRPHRGV